MVGGTPLISNPSQPGLQSQHARKGRYMNKHLIWIDGDDFSGWCCSHCTWGMTAPRLESTVAALTFNRVAQEDFEKHNCVHKAQGDA
jgi:hypothetical protein